MVSLAYALLVSHGSQNVFSFPATGSRKSAPNAAVATLAAPAVNARRVIAFL